ncbi:MAG: hypothetical protein AAGI25_17810 [Bacteroidota bacterium]
MNEDYIRQNILNFPEVIVYEIIKEKSKTSSLSENEREQIITFFKDELKSVGKENIFESQIRYATRLMESSGKLEYEEIHKHANSLMIVKKALQRMYLYDRKLF